MESRNGIDLMKLIGEEESAVDEKGRVAISKKQRDRLGPNFVMTTSEYGCLAAYPEESWQAKVQELSEVPVGDPYRVDYAMLFLGPAEDMMNCDKQGRVVIPKHLRTMANIKSRVVVIGVGDRYLIWDKEEYETYKSDREGYNRETRDQVLACYNAMRRKS
ncbi:MAG: hypothetical protein KF857_00400 [Fimbriimonadaceae bacterium]|nr:hypothetical protein [Fimbriimonadaceae bacterium]